MWLLSAGTQSPALSLHITMEPIEGQAPVMGNIVVMTLVSYENTLWSLGLRKKYLQQSRPDGFVQQLRL